MYKLALDLGATSIGWTAIKVKGDMPVEILDMGVRIYDDGRDAKTKEPTAVARRLARGIRRNKDRKKGRVNRLRRKLVEIGFFPVEESQQKALECQDPYALRQRALDEKLSLYELGRAFLHMAQRRGFKSNRKSDKGSNEAGPVKEAAARLEQQMMAANTRTLGEYLHSLPTKRVRRLTDKAYSLYPFRFMYEHEFDKIVEAQQSFGNVDLNENAIAEIRQIIFFQRDLHKPEVGFCTFEYASKERRAPLALPAVQEFRIFQEIANLDFERYTPESPHMSVAQKSKIAELLEKKAKVTFKAMRKVLNVSGAATFNLESDARSELKGNETAARLSHKNGFGNAWFGFGQVQQTEIVQKLLNEEDETQLKNWLNDRFDLSETQVDYLSNLNLPEGYGRLSLKAIDKILPYLKQGLKYSEACEKAGYHHSDFRTGEVFDRLPYYGEALPHRVIGGSYDPADETAPELFYGKVNNPTVHIVLNQLRKLVNACIERWGHPHSIAVELARDLKTPPEEERKINARNKKDNDRIALALAKLDVKNNYANRMRYKLWEDLSKDPMARCCPFSGITIAPHQIFSPEFEVEHLVPFSRCFNDGRGNKVLAARSANRIKGNRTPFEAFSHSPAGFNWQEIQARADQMPSKRRYFRPDAVSEMEGKNGILARQLNDTRYLSRLAKEYLQFVCGPDNIITIPGQMTALLRRKWGLESEIWESGTKNREDHRHHAIDAFVVGCTTRSMLQKISGAARQLESNQALQDKRHRLIDGMPYPHEHYLEDVKAHFDKLIISHKPDHGNAAKGRGGKRPYTVAKLHEETAYGLVQESVSKGKNLFVTRKAVEGMTKRSDLEQIVDGAIRSRLLNCVEGLSDGSKEFASALQHETQSQDPPIYRVRCHVVKTAAVMIPVKDKKTGLPYKYYQGGGNAFTEIFMPLHGKKAGVWQAETISQYDAHQPDLARQWKKDYPTAKLIMRLHNNDMVAYEEGEETIIARVKKMTGGRVYLRSHLIAFEVQDKLSWGAFAPSMQKKNLRKVSVDILGRVRDPFKKGG